MNRTQRAYLKSLASNLDSLFQIGKNALTPDVTNAVSESFNTHELVKITVLKNCDDNINEMANALADRTSSTLVQVIGRKIVLYKPFKDDPQIVLPK
jgi:RNA-binding protein